MCKLGLEKAEELEIKLPTSTGSSLVGRTAGEWIGCPLQYSWAYLVTPLVKNPPAMQRPGLDPWVGKIPWRRERLPIPIFWPGEFQGLYSPWGHRVMAEPLYLELPWWLQQ